MKKSIKTHKITERTNIILETSKSELSHIKVKPDTENKAVYIEKNKNHKECTSNISNLKFSEICVHQNLGCNI